MSLFCHDSILLKTTDSITTRQAQLEVKIINGRLYAIQMNKCKTYPPPHSAILQFCGASWSSSYLWKREHRWSVPAWDQQPSASIPANSLTRSGRCEHGLEPTPTGGEGHCDCESYAVTTRPRRSKSGWIIIQITKYSNVWHITYVKIKRPLLQQLPVYLYSHVIVRLIEAHVFSQGFCVQRPALRIRKSYCKYVVKHDDNENVYKEQLPLWNSSGGICTIAINNHQNRGIYYDWLRIV
jgi:hypothetical protein